MRPELGAGHGRETSPWEDGARSVAENTAAGEDIGNPVAASDANDAALTYALSGTDAESFAIDSDTGQLMTLAALDYETKATYSVTVTASDSGGLSDSIDVTITVTDVDEAPVIAGDAAPNYAENGTGPVATYSATDPESATITWSLEGDDAADFEISAGGVLTFNDPPDYEMPGDADEDNVYEVTVVVTDGEEQCRSRGTVTVKVTNVDEDGTVTLSALQPRVGVALTASLTDPDGGVTGVTWQWASSDAMDGTFADIDGATSDSYTPVEGDAGKYLRATAMYTDHHEEGSGKSAEAVSDNAVVAGETQDPLLTRYDANSNGEIDRDEVITAINDYLFEDAITRDQVIDVLNLYLFDFDS